MKNKKAKIVLSHRYVGSIDVILAKRVYNHRLRVFALVSLCIAIALLSLVFIGRGIKSHPAPEIAPQAQEMPKTAIVEADGSEFCGLKDFICPEEAQQATKTLWRTVTAYNVGDPSQTDASPCIGATGIDLCKLLASGVRVVASNEVPLYTKVRIDGVTYKVLDRTNSRYGYRYDIAFPKEQKAEALVFGSKTLAVEILN